MGRCSTGDPSSAGEDEEHPSSTPPARSSGDIQAMYQTFQQRQLADADIAEVTKLIASDGAGSDEFGLSVAVDGDIMVVGSQGNDGSKGKKTTALRLLS